MFHDYLHRVNDYLHRSGRTARGGGNGVVYNVIKPDEEKFWSVIKQKFLLVMRLLRYLT